MKNLLNNWAEILTRAQEHEVVTRAAALGFYSSFSFAPLILLISGFLGVIDSEMQQRLLLQVGDLVGSYASNILNIVIENAKKRPDLASLSGISGLILLLFSASIVFSSLRSSLDIIFSNKSANSDEGISLSGTLLMKLKDKIISIGIVLGLIFISLFSLLMSASLSYVLGEHFLLGGRIGSFFVSLIVFTFIFALIYKFIPSKKLSSRASFYGGFITAVLFSMGKFLIGFYIGQKAIGTAYGPGGSLVALLVWLYYSSIIVFIGAELTSFYFTKKELFDPYLSAKGN